MRESLHSRACDTKCLKPRDLGALTSFPVLHLPDFLETILANLVSTTCQVVLNYNTFYNTFRENAEASRWVASTEDNESSLNRYQTDLLCEQRPKEHEMLPH